MIFIVLFEAVSPHAVDRKRKYACAWKDKKGSCERVLLVYVVIFSNSQLGLNCIYIIFNILNSHLKAFCDCPACHLFVSELPSEVKPRCNNSVNLK